MMRATIKEPESPDEFDRYYDLRWRVLREHLGLPRGSERDEGDAAANHVAVWDERGAPLAAGRLHFNSPTEAQIRYMAVDPAAQRSGYGRQVIEHLEGIARERGATTMVLNSRDTAAGFYQKLGYEVVAAGPTLFGAVPHVRMEKRLGES
jgi:ribosomal protein S18 acetylase RimI-like enzyme